MASQNQKEINKAYMDALSKKKGKLIGLLNKYGYPTTKDTSIANLDNKIRIYMDKNTKLAAEITKVLFPVFSKADEYVGQGDQKIIYGPGNVYNAVDGSEDTTLRAETENVQAPSDIAADLVIDTLKNQTPEDKAVIVTTAIAQDEKSKGLMGIYKQFPVLSLVVIVALLAIAGYYASKLLKIKF